MIFLERRMVIDMIYRHIRQKDKVLTSRRVVSFEMDENGVSVECQDGSVHRGSILIGADGIRSTVSRQMSQLSGNSKKGKYVFRLSPVAVLMLFLHAESCALGTLCLLGAILFSDFEAAPYLPIIRVLSAPRLVLFLRSAS